MTRRSSFFTKQLLAVLSVNFMALTLVAFLLYSSFVDDYKKNLVDTLSSQSALLASASRSSLLFSDAQTTDDLLQAAAQLPGTRFARVYTPTHALFAGYSRAGVIDATTPQDLPIGPTFRNHKLYFVEPIEFEQEVIGYLILSATTDSLDAQQQHALMVVLGVLIVSMLVSYLFNWRLQRMLTNPVNKLIQLVTQVAHTRKYDARLPVARQDELGELFTGVNDILATVQDHQRQLETHNTELESLVKLRTEQLFQRANYDALTQLPNRHLFVELLEQGLQNAEQRQTQLAVLFLDLDRFKIINDSLGHDAGDKVLIQVAHRLTEIVRQADAVCRWGGDEFVIMVENFTLQDELIHLAERIIASLNEPMLIQTNKLHISTSIGMVTYPDQQTNGITLLKHADTSMYHAKQSGPGHWRFFDDSMLVDSINRLSLESKLRQAITDDAFTMVYQPQYYTGTNKLHGLEALIRWYDAKGTIAPGEFIPVAEEAGLINPLSVWILNQVCAQIHTWLALELPVVPVAVNLPACFITQTDSAAQIEDILKRHNVPPALLEVELTENTFISATDQALASLYELKQLGISVSIDDFGTGYSCLSYLSTLPVDKLKIDGSFVSNLGHSQSNDGIVSAIVMLAKSLKLTTVGECVEDAAQMAILQQMGCEVIQGYYYNPPLPPGEVQTILADQSAAAPVI